jgi:hypothetical protein
MVEIAPNTASLENGGHHFGGERREGRQAAQKPGDREQSPLRRQCGKRQEHRYRDADQVCAQNVRHQRTARSCGKVEFSRFAKYQRRSAPSDAPIAMAMMEITMDGFPVDFGCLSEAPDVGVLPGLSSPRLSSPLGGSAIFVIYAYHPGCQGLVGIISH